MLSTQTGKPPDTSPKSGRERASDIPPGAPPGSTETSASFETCSITVPKENDAGHRNKQIG
eukprot:619974-Pyramimonas_sp.AAC.1